MTMAAISLDLQDLSELAHLVPDLRFDDAERQEALLESGTRDFNAVPGSGKTSLLAAKLLLLARKWPHTHKGICILSHTNIAREEITRRLVKSAEGSRLLHYPHFIGTIHGFVNQFLAMAALRHEGVKLEVIDDDIFARRAWSLANSYRYATLRAWLRRQANGEALITKLFYKNATLDVLSEGGKLPGAHTASYKQMVALKRVLADEGVLRHRDMFAYAELALVRHPHLLDVIHRRFPMVFIDEMQDTSWEQEDILNRLFDDRSAVQRFGDIDQKIISNDRGANKATFPRDGHGIISTSKRFGQRIAEVVTSVRISHLPVIGEANDIYNPVLMLYKTTSINSVLYRFGDLVVDRFEETTLKNRAIRAMCARSTSEAKVEPGRRLGDYWPAFDQARDVSTTSSLQTLLQGSHNAVHRPTFSERANDVRRGVLMVLRAAKAPVADEIRDGRSLLRAVRESQGDTVQLQMLIRELTLSHVPLESSDDWVALFSNMYTRLASLLPEGMTADEFAALEVFASFQQEEKTTGGTLPTICTVMNSGRSLEYGLGTVASMKGETHIASLVLESHGGQSKRFDLQLALPFIAGIAKNFDKLKATQQAQMRNLYVAMSRPTDFLCLAANESRVDEKTIKALEAKGWGIIRLN